AVFHHKIDFVSCFQVEFVHFVDFSFVLGEKILPLRIILLENPHLAESQHNILYNRPLLLNNI
ncbi:MAG TPA: hypothetical protein PKX12_17030, partial [Spirochaetota bacterium]|nr:hypothetical protein [Spirochaetota bacterium]